MKCVICGTAAEYIVENPGAADAAYCDRDLPWVVDRKRDMGERLKKYYVKKEAKKEAVKEEPVDKD